jgi:glycerophosphoryl diester phosphodiesterase
MDLINFQPPVIAHRGASAYAPENTLIAFTKAAQLGIKWVEFDVMLAADGHPIVFHDELLDRTTNGRGPIGDYSYHYLRTLDAGKWFSSKFSGERIPSLAQVLEFLLAAKISANVEIKPLPGQENETAIQAWLAVNAYFYNTTEPSILFSSFSVKALEALRQQSKTCLLGLLMHTWLPNWQQISEELHCLSIHVNQEILTAEKAKRIKETGRMLLCYTVNDPLRAKELYSWGVDAVFSDVPDKILSCLSFS